VGFGAGDITEAATVGGRSSLGQHYGWNVTDHRDTPHDDDITTGDGRANLPRVRRQPRGGQRMDA
jgi:hypothetical protein